MFIVVKHMMDEKKEEGFVSNTSGRKLLGTSNLLGLLKWNTPTVYNGWEQITTNPHYGRTCFNLEPIQDHSPDMGPMVGYAVTVKINPGTIEVVEEQAALGNKGMWSFMATLPTDLPKIVVVQDLSKPVIYGSMWGEVNATFFKSVGAVGCITDGGVRDLDEMKNIGFHAMSRGVTISHSYGVVPVEVDVPITAFGVDIRPGIREHLSTIPMFSYLHIQGVSKKWCSVYFANISATKHWIFKSFFSPEN